MDSPFIGTISAWPMDWAPTGWAFCDGSLLPIAQYQALFSLVGTRFGGNGTTNFGLPDLRGRVIVGMGAGTGLTPRILASPGGGEKTNATVGINNLPPHNHASAGQPASSSDPDANVIPGPTAVPSKITAAGKSASGYNSTKNTTLLPPDPTGVTGGGQAVPVETMQPFLVINYIIALEGLYPTRS